MAILKLEPGHFQNLEYWPGEMVSVMESAYRFEVSIGMSPMGRQRAVFAGSADPQPYFEFVQTIGSTGLGGSMVPYFVEHDGRRRFLMILEQRGPLLFYSDEHARTFDYVRPRRVELERGVIDLSEAGSLEFPGGGFRRDEGIRSGKLREAFEELGISDVVVDLTWSKTPVYPMGSDMVAANFCGVMRLPDGDYERFVHNDGGLQVYALTEAEIDHNIAIGAISSGQAVITAWNFYKMLNDPLREPPVTEARKRGCIIDEVRVHVVP